MAVRALRRGWLREKRGAGEQTLKKRSGHHNQPVLAPQRGEAGGQEKGRGFTCRAPRGGD